MHSRFRALFTATVLLPGLGCAVHRIPRVDIHLQNRSSLPMNAIELRRSASVSKDVRGWFNYWGDSHRVYLGRARETLSPNAEGRVTLKARTMFHRPSSAHLWTDDSLWLQTKLPKDYASPYELLQDSWQLFTGKSPQNFLLTERQIHVTITPAFAQIMKELVPYERNPARIVLDYGAVDPGNPFSKSGERAIWTRGARRIDLTPLLTAQLADPLAKELSVEIRLFILAPAQTPEFDEVLTITAPILKGWRSDHEFQLSRTPRKNLDDRCEIRLDQSAHANLLQQIQRKRAYLMLEKALENKDLETIKVCLAGGLDPNATEQTGFPLLFRAIWTEQRDIIEAFLERGANLPMAHSRARHASPSDLKEMQATLKRLFPDRTWSWVVSPPEEARTQDSE